MIELLKKLCELDATSGDEAAVRDYIIGEIDGYCKWQTDRMGNIIAFKKGRKQSKVKLMIDAHMDEVGLIITNITPDGFLKFMTVGGIDTSVLMFKSIRINGKFPGVIGGKPIHLLTKDEAKKLPEVKGLYIDIGVASKEAAEALVKVGDRAVLCGDFQICGENIISKAIDDRIGCATLIKLLKEDSEYDFYASFSVQEEIGLRGAKTAAFSIDPQAAIILEATTAADIAGVANEDTVCSLGKGPAISFMDKATVYDRAYYNAALNSGIPCQPKAAVAGGNNSEAVHLSREGVRTIALSVPCRYIHSPSCVANIEDCKRLLEIAKYMLNGICGGEIS